MCLQEAHRFLHEGLHQHAIPAALEALKFLTEVYGSAHIEVTPAYLVLAEATIGKHCINNYFYCLRYATYIIDINIMEM